MSARACWYCDAPATRFVRDGHLTLPALMPTCGEHGWIVDGEPLSLEEGEAELLVREVMES